MYIFGIIIYRFLQTFMQFLQTFMQFLQFRPWAFSAHLWPHECSGRLLTTPGMIIRPYKRRSPSRGLRSHSTRLSPSSTHPCPRPSEHTLPLHYPLANLEKCPSPPAAPAGGGEAWECWKWGGWVIINHVRAQQHFNIDSQSSLLPQNGPG